MRRFLKGAVIGALVLAAGLCVAPPEALAVMPVASMTARGGEAGGAQAPKVEAIYWHRGWRGYGWRRPGWRYGYGWRRPYGWGWRRPYHGRFYRW